MAKKRPDPRTKDWLAKILGAKPETESIVATTDANAPNGMSVKPSDFKNDFEYSPLQDNVVEAQKTLQKKSAVISDEENDPSLSGRVNMALETINHAIKQGFKFTDAQKDIGILMSLNCITESEREWFIEIAEKIVLIPYWQCLWGQFRRCHEWGMANAPLLDSAWKAGDMESLEPRECEWCHKIYAPTDRKQDVCSNYCGGQKELHRLVGREVTGDAMTSAKENIPQTLKELEALEEKIRSEHTSVPSVLSELPSTRSEE